MGCSESTSRDSIVSRSLPGGIWPHGQIFFKIALDINTSGALVEKVQTAVNQWNQANQPHCVFVPATPESKYWVNFIRNDQSCPHSQVGCWYRNDQAINLPLQYPIGFDLSVSLILHEMMHCAGFEHETYSYDGQQHMHLQYTERNSKIPGVQIGMYDKSSIMHNGYIDGINAQIVTFSPNDLAAIKRLYTNPKRHHGKYHRACNRSTCSNTECNCGNCGFMDSLGFNCGYQGGYKGHWTCCFDEDQGKLCATSHVGYWHPACEAAKGCTPSNCRCENCNSRCPYQGMQGHWTCCRREGYKTECVKFPYI